MQTQNFRFNTHTRAIFSSSFDWPMCVCVRFSMFFPCNYYDCCCYFVVVVAGRFISILFSFFAFFEVFFSSFRKSRFTFLIVCKNFPPKQNTHTHDKKNAELKAKFFEKQIKLLGVDNILYIISDSHTHTCIVFVSFFDCLLRFSPGLFGIPFRSLRHFAQSFFFLLLFFFFFFVFIFLLRTFCLFFAYSNAPYVL